MSERTTAEIVTDLRGLVRFYGGTPPSRTISEAADRLAELDAAMNAAHTVGTVMEARLDKIDALRPPCPKCGGSGLVPNHVVSGIPQTCPDCIDHPGKVSIEQLVATYNAVHEEAERLTRADELGDLSDSGRDFLALLRSVKP